jgi:hypothetical protein
MMSSQIAYFPSNNSWRIEARVLVEELELLIQVGDTAVAVLEPERIRLGRLGLVLSVQDEAAETYERFNRRIQKSIRATATPITTAPANTTDAPTQSPAPSLCKASIAPRATTPTATWHRVKSLPWGSGEGAGMVFTRSTIRVVSSPKKGFCALGFLPYADDPGRTDVSPCAVLVTGVPVTAGTSFFLILRQSWEPSSQGGGGL